MFELIRQLIVNLNRAKYDMFFAAPAAKFWKRDINSASEREFLGFFGDFLVAELAHKKVFLLHKN